MINIGKFTNLVAISLLFLLIVVQFYNQILNLKFEYPGEYRNAALIDIANSFSHRQNPFTIEFTLPHTYTYGLVPPILVSVISSQLNLDIAFSQKITSFLSICLLSLTGYFFLYKTTKNYLSGMIFTIIIFASFTSSYGPEVIGVALYGITLMIISGYKKFTYKSIFLISVLSTILFYIKQYFLIVFPITLVYFLFTQPKKLTLSLLIQFTTIFCVSVFVVNKVFPFYFIHTIINNINMYNTHSFQHMIKQTVEFCKVNFSIVILFITTLIQNSSVNKFIKINFPNFNKPLFMSENILINNVNFIATLLSLISLTFMLGQHTGTFLTYYQHLLLLPMSILGIQFIFKSNNNKLIIFFFIIFITFSYKESFRSQNTIMKNKNNSWEKEINFIKKHQPQKAYLSPLFTLTAIKNNWPVYDNGQTEVFYASEIFESNQKKYIPLFPMSSSVRPMFYKWKKSIDDKINNKEFSIIALSKENHLLINNNTLIENYEIGSTAFLPVNLGNVEYWFPK